MIDIEKIGNYTLNAPLTSANSGYAKWGFAKFGDKEFFIKEFLCPVYPEEDIPISKEIKNQKISDCEKFYQKKNKLYKKIKKAANGNIVFANDFFRYKSRYYLITDKIDTASISIEEICKLPDDKKLLILKIIAHTVNCLSKIKVIHCDLKPGNLLIHETKDGYYTIKLIDFDSSVFENDMIESNEEIQGDTVYLAPEMYLRLAGEDIALTTKVDVFALGLIFHQCLCGELPCINEGYDYVYEAVLDEADITLNENIFPEYNRIIDAMLDKYPDNRPSLIDIFNLLSGLQPIMTSDTHLPVINTKTSSNGLNKVKINIKGFKPSGDFDL